MNLPKPTTVQRYELCRLVLDRPGGAERGELVYQARAVGLSGVYVAATSPTFRVGVDPASHRAALGRLAERLKADGWEVDEDAPVVLEGLAFRRKIPVAADV